MHADPDPRLQTLLAWLDTLPAGFELQPASLRPASSDASFRRYFRIDSAAGTHVIMDAPPRHEDCAPFVHVADLLRAGGLHVPEILASDTTQGLLLLSDLGATNYYGALQDAPSHARIHELYMDALDALIEMQQIAPAGLAALDRQRLLDELAVFPEWYIGVHCGVELSADDQQMLQQTFAVLVERNCAQPVVLVHRDFHSPNLMLPQEARPHAPGIIDFQDALAGPITYDLASILLDARTTWDEPQQLDWGIRYWEAARKAGLPVDADIAHFHADWEWMSLQRNLRILGVFARLNHRDGKAGYLRHLPRVNGYVRQVAGHYDAFQPLLRLLDKLDAALPESAA